MLTLRIMKDIVLAACTIISTFIIFFLLVGFGWYIVWKLFLSRFKLVRELLDSVNGVAPVEEEPKSKHKPKRTRRD